MRYNICGVQITSEHALRIAKQYYKICRDFPTGNDHQDKIELKKALDDVNEIKKTL